MRGCEDVNWFHLLIVFIGCIIGIFLFYIFQKYMEIIDENKRLQRELIQKNKEIERLTRLIEQNESYNEIIHNTIHYFKLIHMLVQENKSKEICRIIEKLIGKLHMKDIYEYCNHKVLNAILSQYATEAEKQGIHFDAYVEPGCLLNHIEDIDLMAMLGNMFDNSIDAALKKEHTSIKVRIFMHKNGKMCVIKIVNDYIEELRTLDGKLISTKKESGIHGIGIKSILRTAEQYGGFFSHYVENKKFNAVLILPTQ